VNSTLDLQTVLDTIVAKAVQLSSTDAVDGDGRLIAHPDISLVLRNTDMTRLAQVAAARSGQAELVQEGEDVRPAAATSANPPGSRIRKWHGLTVQTPMEPLFVQRALPLRHDDRRDSVSDEVSGR
jgi:hypothetical protein